MDLERTFRLTSYITVATTLVTLALSEGSYVFLAIVALLVFVAWAQEERGRAHYLPAWLALPLSLLMLAVALVDAKLVSGSYVLGLAHFLAAIQLIKLYQPKQDRDYLQLYVLSLLHLMVASVLTTAISFSIAFMIYLLAATWSLMLFHIRGEVARQEDAGNPHTQIPRVSGRFVASVSAVTLLTFLVTLSTFFLVPRVTLGFLRSDLRRAHAIPGFSEEVSLTEIGRIKLSRTRVMRVEPGSGRPEYGARQLWRGKAFDRYTGKGWTTSDSRRSWVRANQRGHVRLPSLAPVGASRAEDYRFSLREINTNVVFTTYYANGITGPARALAVDRYGAVYTGLQHYNGTGYVVKTLEGKPGGEPPPPLFRAGLRTYLQGPAAGAPVAILARQVTRGVRDPLKQASTLERYLRSAYGYSLDMKPTYGRDPVENFLFHRKAGHCELFASAMVLMARSLDIPARYVTGFSGGEWNEFGRYYLVRDLDAHSWVEVYTPKTGWVPFDPTPAAEIEADPGLLSGLGFIPRYFDSLRVRWNSYVIDYSLHQQRQVTTRLRRFADVMYRRIRVAAILVARSAVRMASDFWNLARSRIWWFLGLTAALVAGSILGGKILIRSLRQFRLRSRKKMTAPPTYTVFLKLMERHRHAKPSHLTPGEFASLFHDDPTLPMPAVDLLTTRYYATRFGHFLANPVEHAAEVAALESIRSALTTAAPASAS